ncbi:MAG: hypothetical protein JW956_14330, partial [Calditrichaceae bacterium]|nr:hypothetical protein [Calditrichaceae bacterium]
YSDLDSELVKVTINASDDGQLVYLMKKNNNEILDLNYFSGNKLIRSAEFLEYEKEDGWGQEIPSYIKLTNHQWHYALEIHLLKISIRYDAGKVFNAN